jgi:Type II secretion system (T2SS), protein F
MESCIESVSPVDDWPNWSCRQSIGASVRIAGDGNSDSRLGCGDEIAKYLAGLLVVLSRQKRETMISIEIGSAIAVIGILFLITIQVLLSELYLREANAIPRWRCAFLHQMRWTIVTILAFDLAGMLPLPFAIVALAMCIVVVAQAIVTRRIEDADLLDSLTTAIVASGGSVPDAFEQFAGKRPNYMSRRCRDFANQLRCGVRPALAARISRLPLSVDSLLKLEDGQVRSTSSNAADRSIDDGSATWTSWPISNQLVYLGSLAMLIAFIPFVMTFYGLATLRQITNEFGIGELPALKWIDPGREPLISIGVAMLAALLTWLGLVIACRLYPARWLLRITPWYGGWVRQRGQYHGLQSLAAGLRSGRTLVDSAATTSLLTSLRWTELHTASMLRKLNSGQSFAVATKRSGFVSGAESKWIAAAEATGNLAPTLEAIAENSWRRFVLLWRIRLSWLIPVAVLVVGSIVIVFFYAVLGSLANLIENMS